MITTILQVVLALLKAIPIIGEWFKKLPIDREKDDRNRIDKEHDENKNRRRPSNEFFDERNL